MTPTVSDNASLWVRFQNKQNAVLERIVSVPQRLPRLALLIPPLVTGFVAGLFMVLQHILPHIHHPFLLFIFILASFLTAQHFGRLNGILVAIGLLIYDQLVQEFALVHSPTLWINFLESLLLLMGAVLVGDLLRRKQERLAHLQKEREAWLGVLSTVEKRQRRFLREVLSTMTERRLHLCELSTELPARLPFVPGESVIPLRSSNLAQVRARIRQAAQYIGLDDNQVGELVIGGSEAALNAVVHANEGVAEIRADNKTGQFQIWISDKGTGIDEALLHRATLEGGFSSKGTLGQGFSLIVSTSRRVFLHTSPTGTTIVLEGERL